MNTKLRKQFENIAEIKEMLLNNDELKWCDESERYINGRVFQDAETGYINGALFGWIQSANREGYKLVPVDSLNKILAISDTIDNVLCGINEDDNIQSLLISIDDEVNAMIGVCDE